MRKKEEQKTMGPLAFWGTYFAIVSIGTWAMLTEDPRFALVPILATLLLVAILGRGIYGAVTHDADPPTSIDTSPPR
jgi:hypothetical protein